MAKQKRSSEEHKLQNEIRNEVGEDCLMFRANVGQGWTANKDDTFVISKSRTVLLNRGDVLLRKARPFNTGVPVGFPDLFGGTGLVITPEMVGKRVLVFFALEVKDLARTTEEQSNFLQAVKAEGGIAGIARSVEDARRIVRKPKK